MRRFQEPETLYKRPFGRSTKLIETERRIVFFRQGRPHVQEELELELQNESCHPVIWGTVCDT